MSGTRLIPRQPDNAAHSPPSRNLQDEGISRAKPLASWHTVNLRTAASSAIIRTSEHCHVFSSSPRLSVRMLGSGGKKRASLRGGGTAVRNPKLSAVAVASMTGNDFAMRLDRAIMRSGKLIEAKAIELPQAE